jgi:hypothetical protein
MSKKTYAYYFPENLKYKAGLTTGDISIIASNTGYKKRTVEAMLNGWRKLKDSVAKECLKIAAINAKKTK